MVVNRLYLREGSIKIIEMTTRVIILMVEQNTMMRRWMPHPITLEHNLADMEVVMEGVTTLMEQEEEVVAVAVGDREVDEACRVYRPAWAGECQLIESFLSIIVLT